VSVAAARTFNARAPSDHVAGEQLPGSPRPSRRSGESPPQTPTRRFQTSSGRAAPLRLTNPADTAPTVTRIVARTAVTREGLVLSVTGSDPTQQTPLDALLTTLENCLTDHELHPIRLKIDGRRYVMYPRADA
jgi:hypothetical protein